MNVQSNKYTIIYASVMVIAVAALLTLVSVGLHDLQQENIDNEKRQNVLASIGINVSKEEVKNVYDQTVKETFCINAAGQKVDGDAFTVDMKGVFDKIKNKKTDELVLPVFRCEKEGQNLYVIPVYGAGLWDAIWGYISLQSDFNTIYGAVFDHKGETAGLGAEIKNAPEFSAAFAGKKLFEGDKLVGLKVYKGGWGQSEIAAKAGDEYAKTHGIDGIAGGTITSKAVETMVLNCMEGYVNYFKANAK